MADLRDYILEVVDWVNEAARRDFDGVPQTPQQVGPTATSRAMAMIFLSVHDAYKGATGQPTYQIFTAAEKPATANVKVARVAAVTAAAWMLNNLFSRLTNFNAEQEARLLQLIAPSAAEQAEGKAWGTLAATRLFASRLNDNAVTANTAPYVYQQTVYKHRPDPKAPDQTALGAKWGTVTPFIVGNIATAISYQPPPALASQDYTNQFEYVRRFGRLEGSSRTPDQTEIGIFWGYDGSKGIGVPPRLYNQVVKTMSVKKGASESLNATLFAAVNAGMADGGIAAWHEKYEKNVWRPVIGIREALPGYGPAQSSGENNTGTQVEPEWLPLGAPQSNSDRGDGFTPNFPAYPSGHATFGTVAFRLAEKILGVDSAFAFNFVSEEFHGPFDATAYSPTRPATTGTHGARVRHSRPLTVARAIEENILSRVYLGVHWEFDGREGERIGNQLANLILANPLFNPATGASAPHGLLAAGGGEAAKREVDDEPHHSGKKMKK